VVEGAGSGLAQGLGRLRHLADASRYGVGVTGGVGVRVGRGVFVGVRVGRGVFVGVRVGRGVRVGVALFTGVGVGGGTTGCEPAGFTAKYDSVVAGATPRRQIDTCGMPAFQAA
jgi:hypothetical protein